MQSSKFSGISVQACRRNACLLPFRDTSGDSIVSATTASRAAAAVELALAPDARRARAGC